MSNISASLVKELRERTGAAMMDCKKALTEVGGDIEAAIEAMRHSGKVKAVKKAGRIAADGRIAVNVNAGATTGVLVEVNCETDFVARNDDFCTFAEQLAQRALDEEITDVAVLLTTPYVANSPMTIDHAREELVAKLGENIQVRRIALIHATALIGSYSHSNRIGVLVDITVANAQLAKDLAMHIAACKPQAVSPDFVSPAVIEKERAVYLAQAAESGKPAEIIQKMVEGRIAKFLSEVSLVGQPFVKNPDQTVAELLTASHAQVIAFERFEVGEGIEKQEQNFAEEVMAQVKGKD